MKIEFWIIYYPKYTDRKILGGKSIHEVQADVGIS